MTTAPSPQPTHALIIMEMLSVGARIGAPWVHIDDMAAKLYPAGRPTFYAASIRSTIHELRALLAEAGSGIVADGRRYAIAIDLPGVFRTGIGFVRHQSLKRRVRSGMRARFAHGAQPRARR